MHSPSFSSHWRFFPLKTLNSQRPSHGRAAVLIPQCLHLLVQLRQPSFEDLQFLLWTPGFKSPDPASCQPFFLQKTLGEAVGSLKKTILISKTMADLDCKFIIVNDYRVIHHCSKNIVLNIECTSVRKQLYHYQNILWSHSIPLNHHWSRQQNPLDPIEPPSNHQ